MPNQNLIELFIERTEDQLSRENFFRLREFINQQIMTRIDSFPWTIKIVDSNVEAIDKNELYVDTSAKALTVAAPTNPRTGARFRVIDTSSSFTTNNLTIDGNGKNINGSSNLVLSANDDNREIVYNGIEYRALKL